MTLRRSPFFEPVTPWDAPMRLAEAQGRVMVQADCTQDEALVLMQQRAEQSRVTLSAVADNVNRHKEWFSK